MKLDLEPWCVCVKQNIMLKVILYGGDEKKKKNEVMNACKGNARLTLFY